MKQKVVVMCLLASALLAAPLFVTFACSLTSCSLAQCCLVKDVGIGVGIGAAMREGAHGENAEATNLNSIALHYRIARSER